MRGKGPVEDVNKPVSAGKTPLALLMLLVFDMKIPKSSKGGQGMTVLGTLLVMVILLVTVVLLAIGLGTGSLLLAGGCG